MKSPPRIGVPLKFAVMLDDPGGLCASASVLRPDAPSSPRPVDIPDVARKALRVTGRMTASASHQHQTACRAHAAGCGETGSDWEQDCLTDVNADPRISRSAAEGDNRASPPEERHDINDQWRARYVHNDGYV